MSKATTPKEAYWQKEKRLKARKYNWKETYKKGAFFENQQALIDYIKQPDVLIRVNSAGRLDDGTEFIQITIEGFNS